MAKTKQMSADVWQRVHSCKHNQLCKSTKKGVWVDCMLGKGYICDPSTGYCQSEIHKTIVDTGYKAMKEITNRSNLKKVDFNTLNAGDKAQ